MPELTKRWYTEGACNAWLLWRIQVAAIVHVEGSPLCLMQSVQLNTRNSLTHFTHLPHSPAPPLAYSIPLQLAYSFTTATHLLDTTATRLLAYPRSTSPTRSPLQLAYSISLQLAYLFTTATRLIAYHCILLTHLLAATATRSPLRLTYSLTTATRLLAYHCNSFATHSCAWRCWVLLC
jgi:hypothetical protein